MLACTSFSLNAGKRGSYSKAGKVRRLNSNRLCREGVRSLSLAVTVEFVPSKFAPTRANIIPRFFFHCQAKLGKLR